MYPRTTWGKIVYWLFQDKVPVTKLIIVSAILSFVAIKLFKLTILVQLLGFGSGFLLKQPWTVVTYPLLGTMDLLSLLFSGYWLWMAGGSLERSWGSVRFATFFFLMSAISAIGLFVGTLITGIPTDAAGLWLPIAGVTVAFGMMNPEQQILFFFVIPLKLKYLALVDAVLVLVTYGQIHLLIGLCALLGCAYAYWYATSGFRQSSYNYKDDNKVVRVYKKHSSFRIPNPFAKLKEKRDRKRLKDLFERSGFKD